MIESNVTRTQTYVVQKGDSLIGIAKKKLGDGRHAGLLYELNRSEIGEDRNLLLPDTVLKLPDLPAPLLPELLYNFDDVNVWGHRWINLMRSIKTALILAKEDQSGAQIQTVASPVIPAADQTTDTDDADQDEAEAASEFEFEIEPESPSHLTLTADEIGDDRTFVEVAVAPESRAAGGDQEGLEVIPPNFAETEKVKKQILINQLENLARFVDIDLGKLIASLTAPYWQPTATNSRPPISLLRSLMGNAATDLEIVSKAIQQREWLASGPSFQTLTLNQADRLAAKALAPFQTFITKGLHVNIISYFSRNMHVRKIPYDAQIILIGLPYDSVSFWGSQSAYDELVQGNLEILDGYQKRIPYDYMAIPHEIGHYLYHFGDMPNVAIGDFFGSRHKLTSTYTGWQEELFADTVGCFIAGPLAVLGIQSLLAGTYEQELFLDDGHHPIPALRPFIMAQILRRLSDHSDNHNYQIAPDLLDKNWESHLRQIGTLSADDDLDTHVFRFTLHANHDDTLPAHLHHNPHAKYFAPSQSTSRFVQPRSGVEIETTLAAVQTEVNRIVDRYIQILLKSDKLDGFEAWSQDLGSDDSLQMYDQVMQGLLHHDLSSKLVKQQVRPDVEEVDRVNLLDQELAEQQARDILHGWGDSGPVGGHGGY